MIETVFYLSQVSLKDGVVIDAYVIHLRLFFLRFSECHVTFLQAVSFPAVQSLWGRWAPPLERSKLVSFTYLGTLVITPHYRLTPFPTF